MRKVNVFSMLLVAGLILFTQRNARAATMQKAKSQSQQSPKGTTKKATMKNEKKDETVFICAGLTLWTQQKERDTRN